MTTGKPDIKILQSVLKIIEREDNWCQGSWGRDEQGRAIYIHHSPWPKCSQYCLEGAIRYVVPQLLGYSGMTARSRNISLAIGFLEDCLEEDFQGAWSLPQFNDDPLTSHEDVIMLLKKGIERLEHDG